MMATYDEPVFRWPFSLTASTNDIRFEDIGGTPSLQTISATPKYVNRGETASAGPTDFVAAFRAALSSAVIALGLGGIWGVILDADTLRLRVTRTLGGSPADDLIINFAHAATTIDPYLLGLLGNVTTFTFSALTYSTYQMGNQWAPGIYAVFDSAEQQKTITYEHRNLNGRPIRVNHNETAWVERLLDFSTPGIAAARMLDGRAAAAAFATVGEVETGEPNTWENFKRYLVGAPNAFGDHRVYHYTTSDPSTHVQEGPYEYILGDSSPGLEGVDLGDYVAERSSEYYPARVVLWGES